MPTTIARPRADEYTDAYAGYVALVPDGDLLALLASQREETAALVRPLPDARGRDAYAPGKWSVKEVLGHLADAERIFAYRALRFARGDGQALAGFDENTYVPAGRFNDRTMSDLVDDLAVVRAATLGLVRQFDADDLTRRGVANGSPITVRAIVWIIAGHERHHARLLRERYGLRA